MPRVKTENVLSADNQQATPGFIGESPQRLYAKYPKSKKISEEEALLLGILYTDGCLSRNGKRCWRFYNSIQEHSAIHCGDELNADMSSSFGGIPRSLERGGCHFKIFEFQELSERKGGNNQIQMPAGKQAGKFLA